MGRFGCATAGASTTGPATISDSSETDSETDVAHSDKGTRDGLYPANPPKRRHKNVKKKKKCKTMRRICWRIPKLIFLTGIGLLVVFSMKSLSESGKDSESNSTSSPLDGAVQADQPEQPKQRVGEDVVYQEDDEEGFVNEDDEDNKKERVQMKEKTFENKAAGQAKDGAALGDHLQYRVKRGADGLEQAGKEFKFKRSKKGVAEIVAKEVEPDDEATASHAVIVTGVYDEIFNEVLQLVASVQTFLPNTPIVIFEIGLKDAFKERIQKLCNVDTRPFWPDVFPDHVKDLNNRYWRPFVMQIALAEFHFIVWMDPQTKLLNSRIEPALQLATRSGVSAVSSISRNSPLTMTHPDMLTFLPTDEARLDALPHMKVNLLILHNSEELQENFMKWLLLCASEKECLGPEGSSLECKTSNLARNRADETCHKYDESAMNILLANWFNYDMRRFYIKDSITEATSPTGSAKKLQICHHKGLKRDL